MADYQKRSGTDRRIMSVAYPEELDKRRHPKKMDPAAYDRRTGYADERGIDKSGIDRDAVIERFLKSAKSVEKEYKAANPHLYTKKGNFFPLRVPPKLNLPIEGAGMDILKKIGKRGAALGLGMALGAAALKAKEAYDKSKEKK